MTIQQGPGFPEDVEARRRAATEQDGRRRDRSWPPLPEPLPFPVVDNHTHLEIADGEDGLDLPEQIRRASAVGVPRMVQIGCDLPSARWTAQVVTEHDALVGGVAIHPNEAPALVAAGTFDAALAEIAALAAGE